MRHAVLFALAFTVAHGAVAAPPPAASAPGYSDACSSNDACIAALLTATREGRQIDALAMMASMARAAQPRSAVNQQEARRPARARDTVAGGNADAMLEAYLAGKRNDYLALPETWRKYALFLLASKRPDEAERVLRDGISVFPTHAPFWNDLALAFGQQGKVEEATGAFVVAYTWSDNPAALLRDYAQAATKAPLETMRTIYVEALLAIDTHNAALERLDASLPAVSLSSDIGNGNKVPVPIAQYNTCGMLAYPRISARNEDTGLVTLAFYVDSDGKLLRAKKIGSSGHVELDNATLAGLAACAFEPARNGGERVPAWAKLSYVWSLEP